MRKHTATLTTLLTIILFASCTKETYVKPAADHRTDCGIYVTISGDKVMRHTVIEWQAAGENKSIVFQTAADTTVYLSTGSASKYEKRHISASTNSVGQASIATTMAIGSYSDGAAGRKLHERQAQRISPCTDDFLISCNIMIGE